jgi:hypothetical protein
VYVKTTEINTTKQGLIMSTNKFAVKGLDRFVVGFDSFLSARYNPKLFNLLDTIVFTANCGVFEDCLEYDSIFSKPKKKDKDSKIGCCVGLNIDFIQPSYHFSENYFVPNSVSPGGSIIVGAFFKNTTDFELSNVIEFGPPNILTLSYLDEIIISIIYDSNFENKDLVLYHPVITELKNQLYYSLVLPNTNGQIQNINI